MLNYKAVELTDNPKEKKQLLVQRRNLFWFAQAGALVFVALLLVAALWFLFYPGKDRLHAVPFTIYALFFLLIVALIRSHLRQLEKDIQTYDFEIDLDVFPCSEREGRAEKIFRMNQLQLRRYYETNLSQNVWIFSVGVLCMVFGAAVIGVTFWLIFRSGSTVGEKILTAGIGAIGTILTNYIAAIYLKMHAETSKTLESFHQKLIQTQELLLGNLLAARINDDTKREETLSELSKKIAERHG